MTIAIPKRRPLSLFDDPDADLRHAREIRRYSDSMAAGKPYGPGEPAGAYGLFGSPVNATTTSQAPPRDSADLAPPVAKDNALPELLPEREEDPRDETREATGNERLIFETSPPDTTASDAQSHALRPGNRLTEQVGETVGKVRFYALPDNGPGTGRREHLNSDGDVHFEMRKAGYRGPRISVKDFRPLPGDEKKLTPEFKKALDSLTDVQKDRLRIETRNMFFYGDPKATPDGRFPTDPQPGHKSLPRARGGDGGGFVEAPGVPSSIKGFSRPDLKR